jgi:hypothetical protein
MQSATRLTFSGMHLGIIAVLLYCLPVFVIRANAQGSQGQNAVCSSTSVCSSNSETVGTGAFIDASMFVGNVTSPTFCSVLNYVLAHVVQPTYPNGAVVDTRGLPGLTQTSMMCATSPWGSGSDYLIVPSVILLPAGTITASVPWVLPTNTKLIGVAKGTSSNYVLETTIKAGFSSGAVVQFGDSNCPSSGCQGISVEHLTINGNAQTVNGIENDNCGLHCYVEHVTMYQVLGTGLKVSGTNATDSGPYSNITFDVGGTSDASSQCAWIIGTSGTRGMFVRESRSSHQVSLSMPKPQKRTECRKLVKPPAGSIFS